MTHIAVVQDKENEVVKVIVGSEEDDVRVHFIFSPEGLIIDVADEKGEVIHTEASPPWDDLIYELLRDND